MGSMGLLGSLLGYGGAGGFTFEEAEGAYRDVLYLGDTDDGVCELCDLLGWRQELDDMIAAAPDAAGSPNKHSSAQDGSGSSSKM